MEIYTFCHKYLLVYYKIFLKHCKNYTGDKEQESTESRPTQENFRILM